MSDVQQALATLIAAIGAPEGPTVFQLWRPFKKVKGAQLASWSADRGRAVHVLRFFGRRRASSLTLGDADDYRALRRAQRTKRGNREVSPAQRNREVTLLQRILNFSVARRTLSANPIAGAKNEREPPPRQARIGSESELQRLLAKSTPLVAALVVAMHDTGMRPTEAMKLRWDQIGLDGWVTLRKTKGNRPRRVRLTVRAVDAICALPKLCDSVFANPKRQKPYNQTTLYRYYLRAVAEAAMEGPDGEQLVLHSLRHSFAYVARRRWKLPERTIMRMGGWRTRSAFDRYGIVDEEETADAWEVIDRATGGKRKGPRRVTSSEKKSRATAKIS